MSGVVRIAHSGKQHAYRHALAVENCGVLDRFITSSYYKPTLAPDRWIARVGKIDRMLRRRFQEGLPPEKVIRRWSLEIPELLARRFIGAGELAAKYMFRRDEAFDRWVARKWVRDCEVYWGFQGSCLMSLQAARRLGITAVAEFATAHVTKAMDVLSREAELHPEWASTISNFRFPNWYRERLEQEPHEADVCVAASQFTIRSLEDVGIPRNRIRMLPLGCDVEQFAFTPRRENGELKVLFVGGIGQRKGIKYLLQAIERVNSRNVKLQLLGPLPADDTPLKRWSNWFEYLGQTDQQGVVARMQQADLLVLPSVFEGFGLVVVEAMATGMPVITSTHSCGPEVIREGVDGFVLEPDDVDGLANRICWFAEHRDQVCEMGAAAHERAQDFSWSAHTNRLRTLLESIDSSRVHSPPR